MAVEDEETGQFTIVRGAKRAYCFTVDDPFTVDAEDVPEQITAVILDPSHLYTVVVEGSAETSVPHAVRFARKVVTELGGAVLDQQADGVWSRGSSRTTARPVREERVETVDLRIPEELTNQSDSPPEQPIALE